jgi:hypothetical protein
VVGNAGHARYGAALTAADGEAPISEPPQGLAAGARDPDTRQRLLICLPGNNAGLRHWGRAEELLRRFCGQLGAVLLTEAGPQEKTPQHSTSMRLRG